MTRFVISINSSPISLSRIPARYSLMYLTATSARGLRFQGNG